MKNRAMNKALLGLLIVLILFSGLRSVFSAEGETHNWYCVHVKDHVQPKAGGELLFVEELDGFYIDHKHTSTEDADKVIYLTFDAGYENGNVAKTLDILKEESVTGAFFILGNLIEKNPDLIRRMASEGHTVCNHTYYHRDMSMMDETKFLEELHELESAYESVTGQKLSSYYRPPQGKFSRKNMEIAKKNGYKTVFWSFAYPDWDNGKQMSPERAKQIVLENLHNGEVMLLHPTSATNAAILSDVIKEIKTQGYRFGTLDELTAQAG